MTREPDLEALLAFVAALTAYADGSTSEAPSTTHQYLDKNLVKYLGSPAGRKDAELWRSVFSVTLGELQRFYDLLRGYPELITLKERKQAASAANKCVAGLRMWLQSGVPAA